MNPQETKPDITDAALKVLRKRILRRDEQGTALENPDEMFKRVAKSVAEVERRYSISEIEILAIEGAFYRLLSSLDFLPNSPTLVNAGMPEGQLSGCFVLPIEDSMESIFGTLRDMALIQKTGGGTGFSFNRLRPRNDFIGSTKGKSSGPVSFMRLYNYACEVTREGGVRSGANMGIMRFDHPDILEFIEAKRSDRGLQTFNISVGVTDAFMDCVRQSSFYPLINPRTGQEVGQLNAREVFDRIVESAWETGDPGLVFLDVINRANPTPAIGQIEATNPCGEQPLLPYESCNLGSINVAHFVRNGGIDFPRLGSVVRLAIRFLDNVVDASRYPLHRIELVTKANRKIGLGIMGFADLLLLLGLAYDSSEAVKSGEELMRFVSEEAKAESSRLAKVKGVFPNHSLSVFAAEKRKQRNATTTTIAPTGTISLIANCSSGIEPLFAICYVREMLGERVEFATHPFFEASAKAYLSEDVRRRISESGSTRGVEEIPAALRRLFVTAHDIAPKWHVEMQAAFQRQVDSAVSKTVNLARDATKADVADVYQLAHKLACKGITVFRDSSKKEQVLYSGKHTKPIPIGAMACPECDGPMEHASGCLTCHSCGYTFCNI